MPVRDDVLVERAAHRAGETAEVRDYRRRPISEDPRPRLLGIAVEVDQDVDLVRTDLRSRFGVSNSADVAPTVDRRLDPIMRRIVRAWLAAIVAKHLDTALVVELHRLAERETHGMLA